MLRRIREIKNNQSGFTLIELLIVIVILGVLAAVVVFAVGAFNKNGLQAACKTDFKTVEIADELYYAQHGSTYTTDINLLVTDGYLKELPTNSGYTIGVDGSGPTVLIPPSTTVAHTADGCNALASAS